MRFVVIFAAALVATLATLLVWLSSNDTSEPAEPVTFDIAAYQEQGGFKDYRVEITTACVLDAVKERDPQKVSFYLRRALENSESTQAAHQAAGFCWFYGRWALTHPLVNDTSNLADTVEQAIYEAYAESDARP